MAAEPGPDLGVLVGGVVVEDGVHHLAGPDLGLDGVEEADELLMAVWRCINPGYAPPVATVPGGNAFLPCWK